MSSLILRCRSCQRRFRVRAARTASARCRHCGGALGEDDSPEGLVETESAAVHVDDEPRERAEAPRAARERAGDERPTTRERAIGAGALPSRIGNKRIVARVGEHASGVVYEAWDPQLERKVALFVLRPELIAHPELLARLSREAEAVAALRHPYIASLFALDVAADPPHLAADWIEGRSLDKLIATGELTLDDKLRLFASVLRALGHAHRKQVLHRALTPDAIIVDDERRPHLTRFGTAASSLPGAPRSRGTTDAIDRSMAPYLSPEAVTDGVDALDHRSDLYSAGVIFFELLSGQLPYEGRSAERIKAQITAPHAVSMRALRGLPRPLREIAARALAKAPDARYQSADRWADDLEPLLEVAHSGEIAIAGRGWDRVRLAAGAVCVLATACAMAWLVADEVRRGGATAAVEPRPDVPTPTPPPPAPEDELAALFQRVREQLDIGKVEPALAALIARVDGTGPSEPLAMRLRAFLTYPKPLSDFALVSPEQTSRLCRAAWPDDPEKVAALGRRLAEAGEPLLAGASSMESKLEGQRLLEAAHQLGCSADEPLLALAKSYLSTGQHELALERTEQYLAQSQVPAPGWLLRAQVRHEAERRRASNGPIPLERMGSVVADLEQAMAATAPGLDAADTLAAAQLLWPLYHLMPPIERAMGLVGRMSGDKPLSPFAAWTTIQAIGFAAQAHVRGPVRRDAYRWRFDGHKIEADGPITAHGLFLLPQGLRFGAKEPSCLAFGEQRSWLEVTFFRPTAGARVFLQLRGQAPTHIPPPGVCLGTLTVSGAVIERERALFDGLVRVLEWDVTDAVAAKGEQPSTVRVELSPQTTYPFWLFELVVYGK